MTFEPTTNSIKSYLEKSILQKKKNHPYWFQKEVHHHVVFALKECV
jgi:hypothetical protein